MLRPLLLPRMKEGDDIASRGVRGSDIAPFVPVTKYAGERQVAERGRASVLTSENMIDLMTDVAVVLVDQAILATTPSPAAHLLPHSR